MRIEDNHEIELCISTTSPYRYQTVDTFDRETKDLNTILDNDSEKMININELGTQEPKIK